jgi:membrane-bound lytic murein transglycosylase C
VTQKKVKYKVTLPKNALAKRAEKFTDFAEKESKEFDVSAALIMAIMHSESAFDPNAKSAVPAYGLMQIVPRTAGHDVNKLVRHIDKPMQPKELYIPDVNVETGSAYLSILNNRYLKSIKDPRSRLYCTIAAYNTGAGNVAKVFNKRGNTRNINRAAKVINQLSPQEVYDALMNKLPYDETKHYLQKVSSRIALYEFSV